MAEQSVTLGPGESQAVSFKATPTKAKTYSVSVDGLTGSFKAIVGTGMPSDREIEAVKGIVRKQLDALWFNPCADIHWTDEMNAAVAQILTPPHNLQERIQEEWETKYNGCCKEAGIEELEAEKERLVAIMKKFHALDWHYFKNTFPAICSVRTPGGLLGFYVGGSCVPSNDPLSPYPPTYAYSYLTPEQRELVDTWNADFGRWYGSLGCFGSWDLYYAHSGTNQAMSSIREGCWNRHERLLRMKRELDMDVWYCGVSP